MNNKIAKTVDVVLRMEVAGDATGRQIENLAERLARQADSDPTLRSEEAEVLAAWHERTEGEFW